MLKEEISRIDYELLKEKYRNQSELDKVLEKIENEDYPIQYAIGNVQFLDHIIGVDERVFIPRFATELLVDKVISYIKGYGLEEGPFIDICTGSGCIAISLASKFREVKVDALDISRAAIEVARRNAKSCDVEIEFLENDILTAVNLQNRYSVIISNPPYVKNDEGVSSNTRFEPQIALYPGEDDIVFYKKIIDLAKTDLKDKGMIAFEIGSTQASRIKEYARNVFPDSLVKVEKDYEGFDRFVFIFKNN